MFLNIKYKVGDLVKLEPTGGEGYFSTYNEGRQSKLTWSATNRVKSGDVGLIVKIITESENLPRCGYYYVILHKETLLEINDDYVGEL